MIPWFNIGNQLIEHVLTLLWFDPLNFVLYHYDLCVIVEFQKTHGLSNVVIYAT